MPPKRDKKTGPQTEAEEVFGPLPPNVFLYVQLADIGALPLTVNTLEIHMDQGGSLIVKCVEQFNTEGIILESEFHEKPTYTLIFQQDNLDRINQAADNPLIIKLYMRQSKSILSSNTEEEMLVEEQEDEETEVKNALDDLLNKVEDDPVDLIRADDDGPLMLLCVGYLDIIKLLGHHRSMLREELMLYPVPDVPPELRYTVHTEWHLYTLVPIAKELTFTNMAFITFESIYNLREEYTLDAETMSAELSFRSVNPISRNEYHVIPWCSFNYFEHTFIRDQKNYQLFEFFRNCVPNSYCIGLKSNMEVQMHKLFEHLMRSENLEVAFEYINLSESLALICNSFHRYILNRNMCDVLFNAFAERRYIINIEVFQLAMVEKKPGKRNSSPQLGKQKIFEGILDPAILLFPGVQSIRFAVELKYTGIWKKLSKVKRKTLVTIQNERKSSRKSLFSDLQQPTFAIIKICFLAPLGEVYHELKVFRESFISQNRLLYCNFPPTEKQKLTLKDIQRAAYGTFDGYIRETIRYIVEKNIHNVEEKRGHFCCTLQNLTNILLKIVGSDFNRRVPTTTNVEFANICVSAYNELELRIHNILEKIEDDGMEELIADREEKIELLIDSMNTIKLMNAVGDKHMASFFYDTEKNNSANGNLFEFYDLIAVMERGDYVAAKQFFKTKKSLSIPYEYFAGWIKIFLDYVDTREDPEPRIAGNANECLLISIAQYAERNEHQLDGWILLYCYYKRFDYAAGFSYARWRLEDQLIHKQPKPNESAAPCSLWSITLNISPTFTRQRGNMFFDCFKTMVRLGLYEFAQVIFDDVQYDCTDMDRYMINAQLKILLNTLEEDFEVINIEDSEDIGEEEELSPESCLLVQLHGNVEYYRGNWEEAAAYYERILEYQPEYLPNRDNYLLSKLRLAYISFNSGNYERTISALGQCTGENLLTVVNYYLMGKAYYKLDDLEKAMECFIHCTSYGAHVPDVWGFLALINLQLGNNLNAITCWKYAKIDPTKTVRDETIYTELDMIDPDSVDLYIDVPSPHSSVSVGSVNDSEDEYTHTL